MANSQKFLQTLGLRDAQGPGSASQRAKLSHIVNLVDVDQGQGGNSVSEAETKKHPDYHQ